MVRALCSITPTPKELVVVDQASASNYFKLLGFTECLVLDESKLHQSYLKLSQKFHPDRGGSIEQMGLINQAYQTLKDLTKRRNYLLELKLLPQNKLNPKTSPLIQALSMEWFEVQESENSEELKVFKTKVRSELQKVQEDLRSLDQSVDLSIQKDKDIEEKELRALQEFLGIENTLKSLLRNIESLENRI